MKLNRILVAGEYEENFKIHNLHRDYYEFRFVPLDLISEKDLLWAEAYVGSQPCPGFSPNMFKWVHTFNAGVNNFLEVDGWKEAGTVLTRTVCSFGQRISEYCLSYCLKDLQNHQTFLSNQVKKEWKKETPRMLRDLKIVIFGTGEIGQEVAKNFSFFGSTVFGISRTGESKPYFSEVFSLNKMTQLLRQADVVISTLPLTQETTNLFGADLFRHLNNVIFINVGRGATIDENALVDALTNRNIRQAILDVFSTEPLPSDSDLWSHERIIITPHISAVTMLDEAIDCFFNTLTKIEQKAYIKNQVDFQKGY